MRVGTLKNKANWNCEAGVNLWRVNWNFPSREKGSKLLKDYFGVEPEWRERTKWGGEPFNTPKFSASLKILEVPVIRIGGLRDMGVWSTRSDTGLKAVDNNGFPHRFTCADFAEMLNEAQEYHMGAEGYYTFEKRGSSVFTRIIRKDDDWERIDD